MPSSDKLKPGDRVRSTDTGALGTYLGGGQTRFDACTMNGRHWPERIIHWPLTKLKHASSLECNKQSTGKDMVMDIIDARKAAEITGVAYKTFLKLQRNDEAAKVPMPSPIYDGGTHRPSLWNREDIEQWASLRKTMLSKSTKRNTKKGVSRVTLGRLEARLKRIEAKLDVIMSELERGDDG
jgi:predicted DNA-binding transcriptional regulator AlpA